MAKFVIVLYGDHGGELDREEAKTGPNGIANAVTAIAERCELATGDRIVVERADRE